MTLHYIGLKNGVPIFFNPVNERYYKKGDKLEQGTLKNPLIPKKIYLSVGISEHAYFLLKKLAKKDGGIIKATLIRIIEREYRRSFQS